MVTLWMEPQQATGTKFAFNAVGAIIEGMNEFSQFPSWADRDISLDLSRLCKQGEGQALEFKLSLPKQGHDIGKQIAAFASTNSGRILYGVSDDGHIVGLDEALTAEGRDLIQQRLLSAARDVKPPVHPKVVWAFCDGKVIGVLAIEKGVEAIYYSNHRPIIRRGVISRPAEAGEVEQLFRDRYANGTHAPSLPSTQQIAARMNSVLEMMNVGRYEPLTVADLARALNLSSPADLDLVFSGRSAATFQMIDQFCARFAVNKEWLTSGRYSPFTSPIERYVSPKDCFDLLEETQPKRVYLVRSTSEIGEAFVIVENDSLKFWLLPAIWHVSGHVGGGGAHDLLSLYKLFSLWSKARSTYQYQVLGREVESEVASAFFDGNAFPGMVENMQLSYWWDDLTDLEHKWTTRVRSRKAYGKSYIDAQDIIRKMLARDGTD